MALRTVLCLTVLVLAGPVACRDRRASPASVPSREAIGQEGGRSSLLAIQYAFPPSPYEPPRSLDTLLEAARVRIVGSLSLLMGVVYQFGTEGPGPRYLLVTSSSRTHQPVPPLRFYVVGGNIGLSDPSPWEIRDEPGRFYLDTIARLDGDALPDIAYCYWPNSQRARTSIRAVGFRDGRWYAIELPPAGLRPCEPPIESP